MDKILKILKEAGPLTGRELLRKAGNDAITAWRICSKSDRILAKRIGKRYLRLDKRIKGYARLSPSILREFLTYTVIGLDTDLVNIKKKAEALSRAIDKISSDKLGLSKDIISRVAKKQKYHREIEENAAFIIAGDVVYNMAHREPRPETSINEMVRGSDLDIIIVTEGLSNDIIRELDQSIYKEKYYLLKMPAYREEIDYIIKDISKVGEQSSFNSFEFMVASKILWEGNLLYGSSRLFEKVKEILKEKQIPQKIKQLEKIATVEREQAESYILDGTGPLSEDEYKKLFYTTEEKEEIF